jgi:hypothetical protein
VALLIVVLSDVLLPELLIVALVEAPDAVKLEEVVASEVLDVAEAGEAVVSVALDPLVTCEVVASEVLDVVVVCDVADSEELDVMVICDVVAAEVLDAAVVSDVNTSVLDVAEVSDVLDNSVVCVVALVVLDVVLSGSWNPGPGSAVSLFCPVTTLAPGSGKRRSRRSIVVHPLPESPTSHTNISGRSSRAVA